MRAAVVMSDPHVTPPRASFGRTLRAVLWSFFGVRKGSAHDEDMRTLNPVHVIVVGIGAAAAFVLLLLLIVRIVVAHA